MPGIKRKYVRVMLSLHQNQALAALKSHLYEHVPTVVLAIRPAVTNKRPRYKVEEEDDIFSDYLERFE